MTELNNLTQSINLSGATEKRSPDQQTVAGSNLDNATVWQSGMTYSLFAVNYSHIRLLWETVSLCIWKKVDSAFLQAFCDSNVSEEACDIVHTPQLAVVIRERRLMGGNWQEIVDRIQTERERERGAHTYTHKVYSDWIPFRFGGGVIITLGFQSHLNLLHQFYKLHVHASGNAIFLQFSLHEVKYCSIGLGSGD